MRGYLRFAVSTPWGVKLNQYVLGVIHDNLLVVMGYNDGNGAIVLLRNRLAFDARLNLAINKVLGELCNILGVKLLVLWVGEFLVLLNFLDGKGGELVGLEVQVTGVSSKGLGIDGSEVDLALVLLSNGLQLKSQGVTLLGSLGEDVGQGDAGLDGQSQQGRLRSITDRKLTAM